MIMKHIRLAPCAPILLALAACAGPAPIPAPPVVPTATPTDTPTPASPSGSADDVLVAYFAALHDGRFEDAAAIYGGPYDVPREMNPDLDPTLHAALFERYCTRNGGVCLPVETIVETRLAGDGAERFTVRFAKDDGTVFELGPCCGEPDTGARTAEFVFTVRRIDGSLRVMELPQYVP